MYTSVQSYSFIHLILHGHRGQPGPIDQSAHNKLVAFINEAHGRAEMVGLVLALWRKTPQSNQVPWVDRHKFLCSYGSEHDTCTATISVGVGPCLLLMSSDADYWNLTKLSRSRVSICCVPRGCLCVPKPCFAEILNHDQERCYVCFYRYAYKCRTLC